MVVRDEPSAEEVCPGECIVCEEEASLDACPRNKRLHEQIADSWMYRELLEEKTG